MERIFVRHLIKDLFKIYTECLKHTHTHMELKKRTRNLDTSPKIERWQRSIWKDTLFIICHQEMQIKTMRYHHTPMRMAKIQLTHQMLASMWSNRGVAFTAGGNEKWYSHPGRQLGSFLQNIFLHTIQQLCSLVLSARKGVDNLCPHKNLHRSV